MPKYDFPSEGINPVTLDIIRERAMMQNEIARVTEQRDRLREYILELWKTEEGIDDPRKVELYTSVQKGDLTSD